jgi:phosphatidylglycerophosphatase C
MTPMQLALFDLDGTLTRRDTLFPYVLGIGLRRPLRLLRILVAMPGALLRFLRDRDRAALKETLIVSALRGLTRADIARANERFVPRLLARGLHPEAMERLAAHRAAGDHLVLMSASPDLYVPAVARALGFNETICTGVKWDGMLLDGELVTENRRGEEKRRCVEQLRTRWPKTTLVAYGNSESDLEHLRVCDRAYLVNGADRAIREAARLNVAVGWPMLATTQRTR